MRIIHLTESAYHRLVEDNAKKTSFLSFKKEIIGFLKGLLNDPVNTRPSAFLQGLGYTNGSLRKELRELGVIDKDENIEEPVDEVTDSQTSVYKVCYKVHKDNFIPKLSKMYENDVKGK